MTCFSALVLLDRKNNNKTCGQQKDEGRSYVQLFPHGRVNWDGDGYDDLVRFDLARQRKLCATQGAFIDVTLNMDPVPTTPHLNNRSHEWFQTHGTLGEVFDFPVNSQVDLAHLLDTP